MPLGVNNLLEDEVKIRPDKVYTPAWARRLALHRNHWRSRYNAYRYGLRCVRQHRLEYTVGILIDRFDADGVTEELLRYPEGGADCRCRLVAALFDDVFENARTGHLFELPNELDRSRDRSISVDYVRNGGPQKLT